MLYPKDPKVRVERHEKTLKIEWNWGSKGGYIYPIFGIVLWVIFGYTATLPGSYGDPRDQGNIVSLIVMGFLVFFASTIFGLTMVFNKTLIHADHERFIVKVHPFPWFRPKVVRAKGIQQFFVGGQSAAQNESNRTIYLLDESSHFVRVTSMAPSSFSVHQVCHELQDFYGLEDLPVYGQNTQPHQPAPRNR